MRTKQIEESKTLITNAFFNLLKDEDFESISMSQIAEHAGVSRMTLYRYYSDKSMIIRGYFQGVINELLDHLESLESVSFAQVILERNRLIYHDPKIRQAFRHDIVEELLRDVIDEGRDRFSKFMPKPKGLAKLVEPFVLGGIANITKTWVKGGMKETPEDLTDEILQLLIPFQRMEKE